MQLLEGDYAIARLPASAPFPSWLPMHGFNSVTRTADELSVVCLQSAVPSNVHHEGHWRIFSLIGVFPFEMTGILLKVLAPLAAAEIGIFAISTFETDHILVKTAHLEAAINALRAEGHNLRVT